MDERPEAGNGKDLASISAGLVNLGVEVHTHSLPSDDPRYAESLVRECQPHAVIFYYSRFPLAMRGLRRFSPDVHIAVRSANAEALQAWDRRWFTPRRNRSWVGARLLEDRNAANVADSLLTISRWELDRYWSHMPAGANRVFVPYVPALGGAGPVSWSSRRSAVVCMPAWPDRISMAAVEGLADFARTASRIGRDTEFEFLLSEGLGPAPTRLPQRVDRLVAENPADVIQSVLAVAVLGSLGYGVKTTAVDAAFAGTWVIASPRIAARLYAEIADQVVVVRPSDKDDVRQVLGRLVVPAPSPDIDGLVRCQLDGLTAFLRKAVPGYCKLHRLE